MRLKILFFPSALVVAIIVSIWFISPEFSQFKETRSKLDFRKNVLQELKDKKQNINNLNTILDNNLDKEKLVLEYLPCIEKEEDIINMLNYTATSSGIALLDFEASIIKDAPKSVKILNIKEDEYGKSVIRKTKMKLNLTGSYENIRSFFSQIYGIKRVNDISIINISNQPESENLLAKAEIYFSYLPPNRLNLNDELIDPIFSQKDFNFTVTDDVTELISGSNIPNTELNPVGRSNPFLP